MAEQVITVHVPIHTKDFRHCSPKCEYLELLPNKCQLFKKQLKTEPDKKVLIQLHGKD